MRTLAKLVALALALAPAAARPALKVVTTTQGLAALAQEVGGDRVEVSFLSRGSQDPHFVDANPNLAVKLRQADLLVDVGLDLEVGWLPPLVNQSRNPDIQPTGSRRLTAASAISVMDLPTGPVDRSMGDLHPAGNPHFLSDPRRARQVAAAIAEKLAALDPGGAPGYRARLADFQRRLDADVARWTARLAPFRGEKILVKHRTLTYFADWSGLVVDGYLEPKPGIEPPPSHLAELVQLAKADKVRAVVVETYYDTRSAALVAKLSGARLVTIPGDVGASRTATTYEAWIDELVRSVTEALQA
jgi:zinc/manganese transport system substrate-binding protein